MIWLGIFIGATVGILFGGWLGNAKRTDLEQENSLLREIAVKYNNKYLSIKKKWVNEKKLKETEAKENS